MSAPRSVEFDVSHHPLVLIRYEGRATPGHLSEVFAQRTRFLESGERHVLIHDLRQASTMFTTGHRHMQLDWVKAHDAQLRAYMMGVAFVTDSAALRLLMNLVNHLQPLPMPQVLVSRMSEAVAWGAGLLRQAGLEPDTDRFLAHFDQNPARRSA
ncbi:hypothetical protein [Melittangium boletus]|uniref:STAS/SEC14 domain-containing protein n=1 Tax=Melittangium boletus DSM 14713 TaxID=1294270 RepID=A0A250IF21_9BACT|nr:hypothetical protein [Melittangium boletus]ATB30429.1 hypothetical protein MEBOL_003890 [Melittangium boletus DSM 14713]